MAERKRSGFRFRLPWILQPTLTSRPAIAPEPPHTTKQTPVASTPAQRPPFRPPGIASASVPPPLTLATPATPPASPIPSPPRSALLPKSMASSPPRVPAKSLAPESETAKTLDPVATQPTKETQATSETPGPATLPPQDATKTVQATKMESLATTPPQAATETVEATEMESPTTPPPEAATKTVQATYMASPAIPSAIGKIVDTIETQPTKEIQTTSKTPGLVVPLADAGETQPNKEIQDATEMATPATLPAIADSIGTLTSTGIKPTIETPDPTSLPESPPLRPPYPVYVQPLPRATSPRSPSRLAAQAADKTSSLPSPPSITTSAIPHNTPEIARSSDITQEKVRTDLNHVLPHVADLDAKQKETTEVKGERTKISNLHSMNKITETKSQKSKPITSARLSLHREIKDDISKFIHKMATSPSKQLDEKPASVVIVAGDNIGASMHLGSDAIKREGGIDIQRGYKLKYDRSARDAAINGEGSTNGKKSRRDSKSGKIQETTTIVNSNIQGINNSMMFNNSVTERNPGVHIGFSLNLANTNDSKMKNNESMETNRAEVHYPTTDTHLRPHNQKMR